MSARGRTLGSGRSTGMTAVAAIAPLPGRLFAPVDGDPALRWKGSAPPKSIMIIGNPIPSRQCEPWNKDRLVGQKRPLKPKDVWTIRVRLQLEGRKRDLAMFNLAIDSKLRGCDLVRMRIDDVYAGGRVRDRATVLQKKTGWLVQSEFTEQTRSAIGERLATCDRYNCCSPARSWRAPSAILESRWTMLSPSGSRWSCRPDRSARDPGAPRGRGASNAASLVHRTLRGSLSSMVTTKWRRSWRRGKCSPTSLCSSG